MVRITEELVRKRAEHNESEIFSLEEISLHQQNIEKIEHLEKWCKNLKILYLQSNLISKIENVGRLKQLEYLNLALNNIERIENLEGCEFLKKLDLTVNFIGEITSIENLIDNYHLRELYLTGNPCTDFEYYREYVICTLPQLQSLDGLEIKKSDRIKALQNYNNIFKTIHEKQNEYLILRKKQKENYQESNKFPNNFDDENYWNQKTEFTPESRMEAYLQQEHIKKKQEEEKSTKNNFNLDPGKYKKERRFFAEDGKPYSFNDPKVDYEYNADDDEFIVLTVHVFKHMDSSLINLDVQPNYVRVTLKGKSLQLALSEEIKPDSSTAQRSQITGHLLIKMPKLIINKDKITLRKANENKSNDLNSKTKENYIKNNTLRNHLEVDPSLNKNKINLSEIVKDSNLPLDNAINVKNPKIIKERDNSTFFVDSDDVPPLI